MALIMALLWAAAFLWSPQQPPLLASAGLAAALVCLTWFDVDHYRIPNWITYPLIAAGLGLASAGPQTNILFHVAGAIAGYGFIWALNLYWQRQHGKDGIGMGDAKLLAGAGGWLGILALPMVTLVASGSALALILLKALVTRKSVEAGQRLPFGPFIAIGFWAVWLVGPVFGL